ncbi:glycosyltransferase family 4 protein [Candidatus Dependentiae bacterium]
MRIVISASGRFHSLHLANQVRKNGSLYHLYSAAYSDADKALVPEILVSSNGLVGIADRVYIKFGLSRFMSPSRWYTIRDNWFDNWVLGKIKGAGDFDLFVGWANCSLGCIRECKKRGIKTVIECGSMHIEEQEKILKKAYKDIGFSAPPIVKKNKQKMLLEYKETDYISVPSEHVYKSFVDRGVDEAKLIKVSYGIDVRKFSLPRTGRPKKFRLLFVGQIGVQKGIHILLEAWKQLALPGNEVELILVGDLLADGRKILRPFKDDPTIKIVGPVRHDKLGEFYRSASVFVLPSMQEGLAMVIGEAMASGIPCICSSRTGAFEIMREGQDGFIFKVGDVKDLMKKILWCFENQNEIFEMGKKASARAHEFTWDHYGDNMIQAYKRIVEGETP